MTPPADQRCADALSALLGVAAAIERGHARTPLEDYLHALMRSLSPGPVVAVSYRDADDAPFARDWIQARLPADCRIVESDDSAAELQAAEEAPVCVRFVRSGDDPASEIDDAPWLDLFDEAVLAVLTTGATHEDAAWKNRAENGRHRVVLVDRRAVEPNSTSEPLFPQLAERAAAWNTRRVAEACDLLEQCLGKQALTAEAVRRTLTVKQQAAQEEFGRDLQASLTEYRYQRDTLLTRLEGELAERIARRLNFASPAYNQISAALEDLGENCLSEVAALRTVKLALADDVQQDLLVRLRALIDSDVRDDFAEILAQGRAGLQSPAMQPYVAGALQFGDRIAAKSIDEMSEAVCRTAAFESRYHGELPRRTWFDRLIYGRRPVFAIMMMSSLVGAAIGIRQGLAAQMAPAMLALFVGGIAYTFRSFKQEREDILLREMTRLRETLGNELRRLYETAQRDWSGRLGRELREAFAELDRLQDQRAADAKRSAAGRRDARQSEFQDALRLADQKLRAVQDLVQETARIRRLLTTPPAAPGRLLKSPRG